jgi:hypothetical protein
MLMPSLIRFSPDLRLSIGLGTVKLTPGETLNLAETLIRTATRRMVAEEVAGLPRVRRQDSSIRGNRRDEQ